MAATQDIVNEKALRGKSATEVMSAVSSAMWKAGIDENAIAEYCIKVRGCANGDEAIALTREWIAQR